MVSDSISQCNQVLLGFQGLKQTHLEVVHGPHVKATRGLCSQAGCIQSWQMYPDPKFGIPVQ